MENAAIAMESLDLLARVLSHCGIYERLYGLQETDTLRSLDASQSLSSAPALNRFLVDLYVLILKYLCYLTRYLSQNTGNLF